MEYRNLNLKQVSDEKINLYLVEMAIGNMKHSYSPYSLFKVGAALLADSGKVYSGVNVENASYGATICAERSAMVSAISNGEKNFLKMAVAGPGEEPISPCGICRQTMMEFAPDLLILSVTAKQPQNIIKLKLGDLIPHCFKLLE